MYFDPFGEKVGADGAVASPLLGDVKLGFTGHRHDDGLGLVDMKGRVFDPAQKRFLTPDPHVPDPLSGQSYNRFSYVMNNPLRYTDPSGFTPPAKELRGKGGTTEPDMAAAPVPVNPETGFIEIHVPGTKRVKADDTGEKPPPEPISKEEQERKWADFFKKMSWGGAKQLLLSAPPVVMARQIHHNVGLVSTAVKQSRAGDWNSAASTLLEMPQQTAEGAARIITGPIEAALAVPAGVRTVLDSEADPEKRGAAAIITAQNVATVAMAAAGAARTVKGSYHRPYLRRDTVAKVHEAAPRDAHGRPLDPNTGTPIRDRPDIGHKPGHEFRREAARAKAEGLTQKEFNDRMNNPDLYQLENPSTNRGHQFEQKP